ncbi:hypothetical protein GCM10023321_11400 [Pseudonocardia eucalypti]|uniref:Uncharacterized protein n=1 Tax=Pseudonocardia eucalypti TaxID=648755 RepID=A0ABP9PLQ1_9PSEU|nr:asparagine synthetase B (glutamine-hydrolyzing) [Pseudonocardia eucalypti]
MDDSGTTHLSAETLLAGTDLPGPLWSLPAARRMAAAISADAHADVLPIIEALTLIDRVWQHTEEPRDRPHRLDQC